MDEHYKNISKNFNKVWKFSNDYKKWAVERIGYYLQLNNKDIFVDVGGGTGTFTNMLEQEFRPKKAYCIEPEENMCNIARQYTNIETICSDTFHFINNLKYKYNKILFKEVIHHIDDRNKLWNNIYNTIEDDDKILIYTRPRKIKFPLFKKAKQEFYNNQPSSNLIISELKNNGFKVELFTESFHFQLAKEEWHTMLKEKFMSDLSIFSDEEILKGIEEIEHKYNTDFYDMEDEIFFIRAYK